MAKLIVSAESFSADFKDTIGIVDADFSWRKIKPAVKMATEEVIDLIGEDNYKKALAENGDVDYIDHVKFAILMKALVIFLPTGDLAVTNNGRTMRRDDKNVSAFEWQINKHDEDLENKYYRGLDLLLKYMFKKGMRINQDKYNFHDLIVNSLNCFENHFDIGGSHLLYYRLIPAMRTAEMLHIKPRLGEDIFGEIKADVNSPLRFLVEKIIVNYAMCWGVDKLTVQLFPKGFLSKEVVDKKKAEVPRQALVISFKEEYERDLKTLEKQVSKAQGDKITHDHDVMDFGFDSNDGFVDV